MWKSRSTNRNCGNPACKQGCVDPAGRRTGARPHGPYWVAYRYWQRQYRSVYFGTRQPTTSELAVLELLTPDIFDMAVDRATISEIAELPPYLQERRVSALRAAYRHEQTRKPESA